MVESQHNFCSINCLVVNTEGKQLQGSTRGINDGERLWRNKRGLGEEDYQEEGEKKNILYFRIMCGGQYQKKKILMVFKYSLLLHNV